MPVPTPTVRVLTALAFCDQLCSFLASILSLTPEHLQQNINISIVGGLVASQEVSP